MGFFAAELYAILQAHNPRDPWSLLARMGIHPQQIDRLKRASENPSEVASLYGPDRERLRQELEPTTLEWARLIAGSEADTFLRLLLYHNKPIDQAMEQANATFASTLKDHLATGGTGASVYPTLSPSDQAGIHPGPQHHRPRGPRRKDSIEF